MSRRTTAALAAALALAGVLTVSTSAGRRPLQRTVCTEQIKATVVHGVLQYCGKATAEISVFRGTTFRGGACTVTTRFNFPSLSVYIGQRTLNRRTNGGRAFFSLRISGDPPRLSSMDVLAYAKRKRWSGVGVAFNLKSGRGTFTARGVSPSHGKASGTFRC